MKSGSFNTCLFEELCKDMFSTHGRNLMGDTGDVSPPLFQTEGT